MAPIQLLVDWYPMGKTSYTTLFNVPGKPAWMLSELVSPLTLLYTVYTNPSRGSAPLPKSHIWLTTLFLVHYLHRAVLSPLMGPKIAPFHILLAASMAAFNFCNGSAIGGWLGGFGSAQEVPLWMTVLGSAMFAAGLWGNMYHEEILRDLRKEKEKVEGRRDKQEDTETVVLDGRVYKIPHGGLFEYCWYPHVCKPCGSLALPILTCG